MSKQICSDAELVQLEARNGLLQFDEVRRRAQRVFDGDPFRLDVETVLSLHEHATRDIQSDTGQFREGPIYISGTSHVPPPHEEVPGFVDGMISYVNENWAASPLHLCAYLMWRCNWIHPFSDGNGRTTRALSYLVFVARIGYEPGGTPTWVDMIASDKFPYYHALDAADAACLQHRLDVGDMEKLVETLLSRQLLSVVADANG